MTNMKCILVGGERVWSMGTIRGLSVEPRRGTMAQNARCKGQVTGSMLWLIQASFYKQPGVRG